MMLNERSVSVDFGGADDVVVFWVSVLAKRAGTRVGGSSQKRPARGG
jgi:hypothetical protein